MRKLAGGNFSKLPVEDPKTGDVLAVIETPRGSRNKYAFDLDLGTFRLKAVLPQGNVFPFDFGFIPSTRRTMAIRLLEDSVPMGCALSVRLIGAIEAEQKEKGEVWVRNDRLVGVATHAHVHANVTSLRDLDSCLLDEIEAFFAHYNRLEGKEFRVLDRCGPKSAAKLLDAARRKSENE